MRHPFPKVPHIEKESAGLVVGAGTAAAAPYMIGGNPLGAALAGGVTAGATLAALRWGEGRGMKRTASYVKSELEAGRLIQIPDVDGEDWGLPADLLELAEVAAGKDYVLGQALLETQSPTLMETAEIAGGVVRLPFLDYGFAGNPVIKGELHLALGVDLADPAMPVIRQSVFNLSHLALGGPTNFGKSVGVRNLVYQCLLPGLDKKTAGAVKVAAVDVTNITFNPDLYQGLPQLFGSSGIADSPTLALRLLEEMQEECERRKKLFKECPGYPEKLQEYNEVVFPGKRLPVIMLFLEEWSTLCDSLGDSITQPAAQLAWNARKYGIYIVMLGQDFTKATIGKMQNSFQARMYFGLMTRWTRDMLQFPQSLTLGQITPGRGLFKLGHLATEMQGFWVDKEDLVTLISTLK